MKDSYRILLEFGQTLVSQDRKGLLAKKAELRTGLSLAEAELKVACQEITLFRYKNEELKPTQSTLEGSHLRGEVEIRAKTVASLTELLTQGTALVGGLGGSFMIRV